MDWLDYRDYFIQIANKANWSDNTRCVKLLVALDTALLGVTTKFGSDYTFRQLIMKLGHINGTDFAHCEASNKLATVKKRWPVYAERIRRLVNRAYTNYSPKVKDEQAIKAFLQGSPTKQGFKLKMKLTTFATLYEAIKYGSNLDQFLIRASYLG